MKKNAIDESIKRGIAFLGQTQQKDGSFLSYSSPDLEHFSKDHSYKTTFFSSLILSALSQIETEKASAIKGEIANFLYKEASDEWSFNYWSKSSQEYSGQPYPDDLDDTFCALSALYLYDPSVFTGDILASIMGLLFHAEVKEGGPYRTWLFQPEKGSKWDDVDVAVNANIGYFLHLQDVELPNVSGLIEEALENNAFSSPYYPNTYPIFYFASRWAKGDVLRQLATSIPRALFQRSDWMRPLFISLVLTSLLRVGYPPRGLKKLVRYLLETQENEGSWPADGFCFDPSQQGKKYCAGASSLTTAFCVEALNMYKSLSEKTIDHKSLLLVSHAHTLVRQALVASPHTELHHNTERLIDTFFGYRNSREVIELPFLMQSATKLHVEQSTLYNLATVNVIGWIAYTAYDDFLDGEGQSWQLASAMFCSRRMAKLLQSVLPYNLEFQIEAEIVLDRIDAANAWEVNHTRGQKKENILHIDTLPDYGDYSKLADRSLGHTIAALGVVYSAGVARESPLLHTVRSFFKHYLIARQLNDDAHDWEEDLLKGSVNAVGVMVLEAWKERGRALSSGIDLSKDMTKLRTIMWESVIEKATQEIHSHIRDARAALKRVENEVDATLLEKLLQPLEKAASDAVQEKKKVQDFLQTLDE